ncbi:transcriptional regulator [Enterobacterales bacterium CwR94]|nr:transcriptional regulator [Enterobacterales bacterium CwR94]
MATMKDVAKLARVSVATVSRVINNTAYVEPVTRERVEKAMRTLNYRRNAAAVALATRSGCMLGLLTGNLSDPFFALLASGVEDASRKKGARLMVCNGGHDAGMEQSGLEFLINQGCESIVAHITRMQDQDILRYAAHTPALVLVNRYIPAIAHRCIWLDNVSASQLATQYLIENGHSRIACITSELLIDDRNHRLQGYLNAMAAAGIHVPKEWIIAVPFNEEGGEQAAQTILNECQNFTAVVTFNDVIAAGMMKVLQKHGVRLPEQMSIIGFDDVVMASYLNPQLTTLHSPVERMARRAANLALMIKENGVVHPGKNMFSAELIIRNSVCKSKKLT